MCYKRILAIGDIHGMYEKLKRLMDKVKFDPTEDLLIFLGDYIDRGPQSLECLDYVMRMQEQFPQRVICLKGNHEAMCLNYYWFKEDIFGFLINGDNRRSAFMWTGNGGGETKKQFRKLNKPELQKYLHWMHGLLNHYQAEGFYFCHAGIDPKIPLEQQWERDLLWIREEFIERYDGRYGSIVIGHTPVQLFRYRYWQEEEPPTIPQFLENQIIMCDTGAYLDGMKLSGARVLRGKLSCVDVLSRIIFQA